MKKEILFYHLRRVSRLLEKKSSIDGKVRIGGPEPKRRVGKSYNQHGSEVEVAPLVNRNRNCSETVNSLSRVRSPHKTYAEVVKSSILADTARKNLQQSSKSLEALSSTISELSSIVSSLKDILVKQTDEISLLRKENTSIKQLLRELKHSSLGEKLKSSIPQKKQDNRKVSFTRPESYAAAQAQLFARSMSLPSNTESSLISAVKRIPTFTKAVAFIKSTETLNPVPSTLGNILPATYLSTPSLTPGGNPVVQVTSFDRIVIDNRLCVVRKIVISHHKKIYPVYSELISLLGLPSAHNKHVSLGKRFDAFVSIACLDLDDDVSSYLNWKDLLSGLDPSTTYLEPFLRGKSSSELFANCPLCVSKSGQVSVVEGDSELSDLVAVLDEVFTVPTQLSEPPSTLLRSKACLRKDVYVSGPDLWYKYKEDEVGAFLPLYQGEKLNMTHPKASLFMSVLKALFCRESESISQCSTFGDNVWDSLLRRYKSPLLLKLRPIVLKKSSPLLASFVHVHRDALAEVFS